MAFCAGAGDYAPRPARQRAADAGAVAGDGRGAGVYQISYLRSVGNLSRIYARSWIVRQNLACLPPQAGKERERCAITQNAHLDHAMENAPARPYAEAICLNRSLPP